MIKQALTIELRDCCVHLGGYFTRVQGDDIFAQFTALSLPLTGDLIFDLGAVLELDTAGAWQLQRFIVQCEQQGYKIGFSNAEEKFQTFLNLVHEHQHFPPKAPSSDLPWLVRVGKGFFASLHEMYDYFSFIGQLWFETWHWIKKPALIRWPSIVHAMDLDGYTAIPIVALLSFLIGIVLAYQIGTQLRLYGANIYVVDLLGITVLREFAPLITAIILAGRTGSAHTAQIGTMVLNEEIDALKTLGLSPNSLIVLPKVFALVMVLPLLTVLSEVFSLFGGMIMSKTMLGITFADFLKRFGTEISLSTYVVGLIKTPVFAVLIASIGCFQGYRVTNSAESVGRLTTLSVVQGIFMIIVADAAFSVLFTWLDI